MLEALAVTASNVKNDGVDLIERLYALRKK